MTKDFNLRTFQEEHAAWVKTNFGFHDWRDPFMGVVEEIGELSHALLKQKQGIRGTHAEHEAAAKDAVADIVIYLSDLCTTRGWDFAELVEDGWLEVKLRNWKKHPQDGKDGKDGEEPEADEEPEIEFNDPTRCLPAGYCVLTMFDDFSDTIRSTDKWWCTCNACNGSWQSCSHILSDQATMTINAFFEAHGKTAIARLKTQKEG